ncbi:MAG: helix-turn-helix transcriptional regulator [Kiritimatiellaeota bacterium]|nr:helix-turn-helix transcriptional regulator [Kiritimatiellota bacterium]
MAILHDDEERADRERESDQVHGVLGKNLRNVINKARTPDGSAVSLTWLCKVTTLNRVSIWRLEKGDRSRMTITSLVRLKEALGCSWNDLLKGCESNIVKERKRYLKK